MPTRTKAAAAHSAAPAQLLPVQGVGGSWGQWQHSGGLLGLQEYPALLHGCGAVSHPAGQWGRHPCKAPLCATTLWWLLCWGWPPTLNSRLATITMVPLVRYVSVCETIKEDSEGGN